MDADEVLGTLHSFGQGGDGQRRRVGAKERVSIDDRFEFGEHAVFEVNRLEDGFDDEVTTSQIGVIGSRRDAAEDLVAFFLRNAALLTLLVENLLGVGLSPFGGLDADVFEDDLY